ncbi:MAG TPA: 3-deoxy-8-phosphooctulonate synthase [bacterium]|nr:3-deoxy-8-phosphooctulonate synthase [bacterium]
MNDVMVREIPIGKKHPLVLIAGPCVIESEDSVLSLAEDLKILAARRGMPLIFKASYLKDNRSSADSYQGPGLEKGLRVLEEVRKRFDMPVLSDVHDSHDMEAAAQVLDVIQIPAYLCMQTSLTLAAAKTGKVINVKKGQFLDPHDVKNIVGKLEGAGNRRILLTERGACFGYHNLVVDMRSFRVMKDSGYPVVFDPTHAIRIYGISSSDPRGGAPRFVPDLSRAAVAAGIQALFIETHPNCKNALCDSASMWPFDRLDNLLAQVKAIDELIHSMPEIDEKG